MRDEYWPLAEAVARDLAGRADPNELARAAHYLAARRDAADFFALLDDLAGPAGAALARSGQTPHHQAAVRDACQRLRAVPDADLPEVVGWAVRLLRYQQSQVPPRPAVAVPPGAPARPAPRPAGPPAAAGAVAPAAASAAARPPAPPPGRQPPPPRPAVPGPGLRPAAAAERGPAAPAPPRPGQPPERGPARPAAQQPPPPPAPRRAPTMDDMLRQLQAQFGGGGRGPEPARPAPSRQDPAAARRERARREQEAIRERYRQQSEPRDEE